METRLVLILTGIAQLIATVSWADETLHYTVVRTWPSAIIVVRPEWRRDEAKLVALVKQALRGAPDGTVSLRMFDNVKCAQRKADGNDAFQDTPCLDHFIGLYYRSSWLGSHLTYYPKGPDDWGKEIE